MRLFHLADPADPDNGSWIVAESTGGAIAHLLVNGIFPGIADQMDDRTDEALASPAGPSLQAIFDGMDVLSRLAVTVALINGAWAVILATPGGTP